MVLILMDHGLLGLAIRAIVPGLEQKLVVLMYATAHKQRVRPRQVILQVGRIRLGVHVRDQVCGLAMLLLVVVRELKLEHQQ